MGHRPLFGDEEEEDAWDPLRMPETIVHIRCIYQVLGPLQLYN